MDGPMVSCARGTRTRDQWIGGGAPSRAHNRDQSGHPLESEHEGKLGIAPPAKGQEEKGRTEWMRWKRGSRSFWKW